MLEPPSPKSQEYPVAPLVLFVNVAVLPETLPLKLAVGTVRTVM